MIKIEKKEKKTPFFFSLVCFPHRII
jgi:hypothetical protein